MPGKKIDEELDDESSFERGISDMTEFVESVHYVGNIQPWSEVKETADDDDQ